jgi:hypothetical protein
VNIDNADVVAVTGLHKTTERNNLDRSLSIRQNLLFHASHHGFLRRRID